MNKLSDIKNALIKRDGLKCAVTGEIIKDPDELMVDYVIPRSKGGSDELDNLQLVKKSVNIFLANDEKRIQTLTEELNKRQNVLTNRERELFEREQAYRLEIDQQKKQLEEVRLNIQKEQSKREALYESQIQELRRV
ncbi:hypothetical protein [Methylomonas albis]|uniref:HNH endonuclease n=1 Tax=Methylomonas albis TaxID=1854563 RepID=A0ABR9CZP1_9GAMM|nr:HNH endonuclease [Methylomonas albis]MBD9356344.1 HNH endonuclease [Methylomonas albis]CAD6879430.1 hypothetical protein [Methylomonas albis]